MPRRGNAWLLIADAVLCFPLPAFAAALPNSANRCPSRLCVAVALPNSANRCPSRPCIALASRPTAKLRLASASRRNPAQCVRPSSRFAANLSPGLALQCNPLALRSEATLCPCGSHRRCDYQGCALAVLCQSRLSYAVALRCSDLLCSAKPFLAMPLLCWALHRFAAVLPITGILCLCNARIHFAPALLRFTTQCPSAAMLSLTTPQQGLALHFPGSA